MIETKCLFCGREFKAIRVSKKFCSDSCKTKANMKRRNEEKEIDNQNEYVLKSDEKTINTISKNSLNLPLKVTEDYKMRSNNASIPIITKTPDELRRTRRIKRDKNRFKVNEDIVSTLIGLGSLLINSFVISSIVNEQGKA